MNSPEAFIKSLGQCEMTVTVYASNLMRQGARLLKGGTDIVMLRWMTDNTRTLLA